MLKRYLCRVKVGKQRKKCVWFRRDGALKSRDETTQRRPAPKIHLPEAVEPLDQRSIFGERNERIRLEWSRTRSPTRLMVGKEIWMLGHRTQLAVRLQFRKPVCRLGMIFYRRKPFALREFQAPFLIFATRRHR